MFHEKNGPKSSSRYNPNIFQKFTLLDASRYPSDEREDGIIIGALTQWVVSAVGKSKKR